MTEVAEFASAEAGARSRGIALSAGEIGAEEWSGLPDEDVAELPATHEGIFEAAHAASKFASAANRQFVDHGGVPAIAAGAVNIAEVDAGIASEGSARAAVLTGEAAVVRTLVVGEVLGIGVVG